MNKINSESKLTTPLSLFVQTNCQLISILIETTRFVYLPNCHRQTLRHLFERKKPNFFYKTAIATWLYLYHNCRPFLTVATQRASVWFISFLILAKPQNQFVERLVQLSFLSLSFLYPMLISFMYCVRNSESIHDVCSGFAPGRLFLRCWRSDTPQVITRE